MIKISWGRYGYWILLYLYALLFAWIVSPLGAKGAEAFALLPDRSGNFRLSQGFQKGSPSEIQNAMQHACAQIGSFNTGFDLDNSGRVIAAQYFLISTSTGDNFISSPIFFSSNLSRKHSFI